ncbi:hypothetical protein ABIE13_001340 [Ottowia thiooxydans]|uniref:Uncharacterized protein n=1 Tax=Ottowia thiooxydans TaxID=219182 RepID=A0ABV2Q6E2_9BURK
MYARPLFNRNEDAAPAWDVVFFLGWIISIFQAHRYFNTAASLIDSNASQPLCLMPLACVRFVVFNPVQLFRRLFCKKRRLRY